MVDIISIPGHEMGPYHAAHLVVDDGYRLHVVAVVPEPVARSEGWSEAQGRAFRAAVRAALSTWEPEDEGAKAFIVLDPGRDQEQEERLC